MRLMRNTSEGGRGKYAIIDNRTGETIESKAGDPEEFFVIKLKDKYASAALRAYAYAVDDDPDGDREYAEDILELSSRAARMSNRKRPD